MHQFTLKMGNKTSTQSKAEIFKLKMDHFEELFDWLSFEDIIILGRTCHRMKQIVGYYIKTNYASAEFVADFNGIRTKYPHVNMNVSALSSFLQKLEFNHLENTEVWKERKPTYICQMKADRYKSLTEIRLILVFLSDKGISCIKEILGQLETVKFHSHRYQDESIEFYKSFLQFCPNLKKLYILGSRKDEGSGTSIIGADDSWLRGTYPTLEHFELAAGGIAPIDELRIFFEQNTKIKTFATNVEIILNNIDIFKNINAKWNVLSVKFDNTRTFDFTIRNVLNEQHKRGLFKELNLYFHNFFNFDQDTANHLIHFNGLTKLFIQSMDESIDLSRLINLQYLCIYKIVTNMEELSKSLVNLEFVQIMTASIDELIPLVRYSPKLNTIVVFNSPKGNTGIPSVADLNRKRSKLEKARKITLYVAEHLYLAEKWRKNKTNQCLFEIRRYESFTALNHNFFL